MTDERRSLEDFRFSPFHTDKYKILGSTDEITTAITDSLHESLGLNFRRLWDLNQYVLGSAWQEGAYLRVLRHNDKSPGLDIELTWLDDRPSDEVIADFQHQVDEAIRLLKQQGLIPAE